MSDGTIVDAVLSSELKKLREIGERLCEMSESKHLKQQIRDILKENNESLRSIPMSEPRKRVMCYAETLTQIALLARIKNEGEGTTEMKVMDCVVCPDCQRILSVYARRGAKEDTFEIWQERCSCKIDMAKIDRAVALWHKVKYLMEQLAMPRHELLRITQSMTNDERIAFYKRVGT